MASHGGARVLDLGLTGRLASCYAARMKRIVLAALALVGVTMFAAPAPQADNGRLTFTREHALRDAWNRVSKFRDTHLK